MSHLIWVILRWIAYERRLESSYFLVNRKHVQLLDTTKFGSSRGGSVLQSALSIRVSDQLSLLISNLWLQSTYEDVGPVGGATMNFYTSGIRNAARRKEMERSNKTTAASRDDWLEIIDWRLAKYDNTLVTVRKINKSQLKLTREMKQEIDLVWPMISFMTNLLWISTLFIFQLMNETHENLNRFYGLINENNIIFTLHAYGPRKSLQVKNTKISSSARIEISGLVEKWRSSFGPDVPCILHWWYPQWTCVPSRRL